MARIGTQEAWGGQVVSKPTAVERARRNGKEQEVEEGVAVEEKSGTRVGGLDLTDEMIVVGGIILALLVLLLVLVLIVCCRKQNTELTTV